jgi:hypothetical protein
VSLRIFYGKQPSGGLGNRLFNFHFISQISHELNFEYFYPKRLDQDLINLREMPNTARYVLTRLSAPQKVSSELLLGLGKQDVRDLFGMLSASGRPIVLEPPFLGESFFNSTFSDPKLFFRNLSFDGSKKQKYIGVHLRGGDFHSWNPAAILPTNFYTDALDSLFPSFPEAGATPIFISTDDQNLRSFKELSQIYSTNVATYKRSMPIGAHRGMRGDFVQLANADALVSSPSTFAIWAGILGNDKKIVHSREWVETMASAGDEFWSKLSQGGNEYYRAATLL